MESQVLPPLLYPRTNTPPPIFFFFLLFKKVVAVENKYSVLDLPRIYFPAEPVMKINNLSRPKVSAPPPLRIKWSSPKFELQLQRFNCKFHDDDGVRTFGWGQYSYSAMKRSVKL